VNAFVVMLGMAARNLLRHRRRSGMALASVAFGVVALILTGGFVRDVFVQLGEAIIRSQTGHIQISRAGFAERGARAPEKFLIESTPDLRGPLQQRGDVEAAMARLGFSGLLNNGKTDMAIIGEGIEPDREAKLGSYLRIIAGRQLTDADEFGILVGQGLATAMRLAPGAQVTLLANTADGAMNTLDVEVIGVFQSFSKDFDARAVRMPLAAAQRLLDMSGFHLLVVQLSDTASSEAATAALRSALDPGRYDVRPWYEISDFYAKTVDLYERQFGVLRLVVLLLVLLAVANSVNIAVAERTGEFGTMLALGNRRSGIAGLIVAEGALIGLIGGAVGVIAGLLLAQLISAIGIPMPPPPNSDLGYLARIRVVPAEVALALTVAVAAALAASVLPALRITRLQIVDALRQNA